MYQNGRSVKQPHPILIIRNKTACATHMRFVRANHGSTGSTYGGRSCWRSKHGFAIPSGEEFDSALVVGLSEAQR